MIDLDVPGGADSALATDLNDLGHVIGISFGNDDLRSVLWDDGAMTDLGDLGWRVHRCLGHQQPWPDRGHIEVAT